MQDMNNLRNRKLLISPIYVYICIVLLVYILPSLKVTVPYYAAGLLMLLLLPLLWIKCNDSRFRNTIVYIIIGSSFVGLIGVASGAYTLVDGINESIRSMRFFTPALVGSYIIKVTPKKNYRNILAFYALITAFIFYRTSVALAKDQWITRVLARSSVLDTPELRLVRLQNVGGFEFSYMIGIIVICLVWIVLRTQSLKWRVVCCVSSVLCYSYIIQTMYTTLLLITTVCVLILILKRINNKPIRVILILAFLSMISLLPSLFGYLSTLFDDSLLSTKFIQIQSALTGGGLDSLGSRPDKIMVGLEAWLSNPLIGGNVDNVNSHSMIVGTLVTTGIFGIMILIFLFTVSYNLVKKELLLRGADITLFKVASFYVVVLSFLNPIGYVFEITIAAFIIAPICTLLLSECLRLQED